MKARTHKRHFLFICITGLAVSIAFGLIAFAANQSSLNNRILSYSIDTKSQDIKFYWKDDNGKTFKSILNLKTWLENKHVKLLFAMNGGMYMENNLPLGLFIQDQKTLKPLNTKPGKPEDGNFYIKPNGVFYITTDKKAIICKTSDFTNNGKIRFATQSGPMLVIDGKISSAFKKGSTSLNIRNGVGILPDDKVIFAMSKEEINFYDFAKYFRDLGCKNALYFDGFVSRTYLPEKNWTQTGGDFGVIIAVTGPKERN